MRTNYKKLFAEILYMSDEIQHDRDEDDIVLEPDPDMAEETGTQSTVKKLREQLKQAQAEAKENLDGWQRARADYSNLQKQISQERLSFQKRNQQSFVTDLFAPLDTFEMAMSNTDAWNAVDEKWRQGIEYIYTQLMDILNRYDVTAIEPQSGDDFDPEHHESLEAVATDDEQKDGKIIECKQKGYMHDGSIIRPAKVTFYTYTSNTEA